MNNKTKNILIGVAVIIVIFIAYKLLVTSEKDDVKTLTVSTPEITTNTVVAAGEAVTLRKLKTIKINKELFSSDTFMSLKDFRVEVSPEITGRENPFAPIGSD